MAPETGSVSPATVVVVFILVIIIGFGQHHGRLPVIGRPDGLGPTQHREEHAKYREKSQIHPEYTLKFC
jgi:hypothetical protein